MYLHLGQDTVVRIDEVIGIFDMETSTISKYTRKYLADAEKSHSVINVSMEMPKSFVLCRKKGAAADGTPNGTTVYVSQISSSTLLKRSRFIDEIANV